MKCRGKIGVVILLIIAVVIVSSALILSRSSRKPVKRNAPNNDPWKLVSYDPGNKFGTYLGNGFIATRILGDGTGSHDGQPLQCFVAGLYDNEKLVQAPTWSDLRFYDGKTLFKIDKDAAYKQILDMKSGILATYAVWRAGNKTLKGKIEVIVSRDNPNAALIRATFRPDFDGEVSVKSPVRNQSNELTTLSESKSSDGLVYTYNYHTKQSGLYLGLISSINPESSVKANRAVNGVSVEVKKDNPFIVNNYIALASAKDEKSALTSAQSALADAQKTPVNDFVSRHKDAWAKLWKSDIVIDGPKRDQQVLHSCMFYLLQSVREGSKWSIPPMGLSSNEFSGHVFWDADLWMFPALILQHPELAKSIVDYRYNTLSGAYGNAKAHGYTGAEYAWESGYTGKEDTPGATLFWNERHINGDVALAQWQYYLATGDLNWLRTYGYPVIKSTADYWVSRAKFSKQKNRYEILRVVPPDENANLVDNSAYTNVIVQMNLQIASQAAGIIGVSPNPKWSEVAHEMYIPIDKAKQRFIAFDKYKGYEAKQADSELIIYPLQYNNNFKSLTNIYSNTYKFYASKVMANGPAMTSSAHSVIEARFGNSASAYNKYLNSYTPFLRGPFRYFNEKRSITWEKMCFLTGAAGPIQATIFGLAGARMDYNNPQADIQFKPCLPKQWKSIKLTGVKWKGKTFDVEVTHSGVTRTPAG